MPPTWEGWEAWASHLLTTICILLFGGCPQGHESPCGLLRIWAPQACVAAEKGLREAGDAGPRGGMLSGPGVYRGLRGRLWIEAPTVSAVLMPCDALSRWTESILLLMLPDGGWSQSLQKDSEWEG